MAARDIKLFFSQPSQKHQVLGSLEVKLLSDGTQFALDIIEEAAGELRADAIVFKHGPSDVQIRRGPLRADAIRFLPIVKAP